MKKVLLGVGVLVGVWVLVRVVKAKRQGVSPVAALMHPVLPVALADLAAHPERQQTRFGVRHFT